MAAPDSTLADTIRPLVAAHPGVSGLVALDEGGDAFAARIQLAEAAEHTIDAQYYIWHHDNAGTLLLQALLRAADRGVKVRLLLDDNNTDGLDDLL
ncbi:MAG TPA: phospholipase D-like domain-containing protein, partial [Pseudomonadota bacterium]|nr:phospholipase D-like domain-containing protein [Pseudomonadota bacterium]